MVVPYNRLFTLSRDFHLDLFSMFAVSHLQVVTGLQIHPALCIGTEIAGQPQRGVRGDAAPLAQDVAYARGRDAQPERQRVGGQSQGFQVFLTQDLARVNGAHVIRRHGCCLSDNR